MDNFKLIYKILKYLEQSMDYEEFDEEHFQAKYFDVTDVRFYHVIKLLLADGYITGIKCESTKTGTYMAIINPRLTIQGMEYLENNSMMKKAYRLLKGIKEVTPGI